MSQEKSVPTSKLARLGKIGGLFVKVASNVMVDGARQLSKGQSSSLKELVLQPRNIEQLADKLAQLRGAAMKVGQLLSMDAGDLLPPQLTQLLDKLRSDAAPMPYAQLNAVLESAWGKNWLDHFSHFNIKPFASASIGQVHLAYRDNGAKLAVKVQYPGVAQAINSDVDNVAMLLKMSGLLPSHLQIDGLLAEAKRQLLVEADYQEEADFIDAYQAKLNAVKRPSETLSAENADEKQFVLPMVERQHSSSTVLVMSFIDGVAIDTLTTASQAVRDQVTSLLIGLFFDELFDFKLMQTDPNFANYLYQHETERIVLLDFGATRIIPNKISKGYFDLICAGAKDDPDAMVQAAKSIGFFADIICPNYLEQIAAIFRLACEPLRFEGEYDFAASGLAQRIKAQGLDIDRQKEQWHTPPVDALFIHRKIAGLYLLAAKLQARINVNHLFAPYLADK